MSQIEPNVPALASFIALWSICCVGFFQLAGMYPLRRRQGPTAASTMLVLASTALWLALMAATLCFAVSELRWTSIVIMAAVLFLFVPDAVQALPRRLRDGRQGLIFSTTAFAVALLLLANHLAGGDSLAGFAPLI